MQRHRVVQSVGANMAKCQMVPTNGICWQVGRKADLPWVVIVALTATDADAWGKISVMKSSWLLLFWGNQASISRLCVTDFLAGENKRDSASLWEIDETVKEVVVFDHGKETIFWIVKLLLLPHVKGET